MRTREIAVACAMLLWSLIATAKPARAQESDLERAQKLVTQAEEFESAGDFAAAIPLAREALSIRYRVVGRDDPQTLEALGMLATLCVSIGAFAEGEALLRQAFEIHQALLGKGSVRGLSTGRALLSPDVKAPEGYGLNSYLLFDTPPKDEIEERRYLSAIGAYLLALEPLEELERYKRRSQLNATFVPVKKAPELPASVTRANQAQVSQQVLAQYDYARAKVLLDGFDQRTRRGGPYLVSTIAGEDGGGPYLFVDMSHVAPTLALDWVRSFCWLAAQERSWTSATLEKLSLNTRNAFAVAAKNAPDVINALTLWVRFTKR